MLAAGDPRVPGRTRVEEALTAFVFTGSAIALLGGLAHFTAAPLVFPSLGPTAFLIFHRPTAAAASPRNALAGHLIGVGCGLASLAVFGLLDAAHALEAGVTLSRAGAAGLSLGATAGLMVLVDRGHPPAGATTLIVSLGLMTSPTQIAVLVVGIVLLLALGIALHRAFGTPYPWWSPGSGP